MKYFYSFSLILFFTALNAQYSNTLGVVAYYPFDGDANDYSGNANNGVVYGATLAADRFNVANKAYSFDGFDDYIEVPGSPSFDVLELTNQLTISAWINIRDWYQGWSHFMMVERHRAANDNGWGFAILKQPAQVSIFYPQDMALTDTIGFQPQFNTWYHVAVTWNKNVDDSARMYINGVKMKTFKTGYAGLTNTNNGIVYIGRSIIGIDEYSDGMIDDLGLYRSALNDQQIDDIYNGCMHPIVSISSNQTVGVNGSAQFVASSSFSNSLYQWQINTGAGFSNLANTAPHSGVTTSVLTVANVSNVNNASQYRCIITGCKTETTTISSLFVNGTVGTVEVSDNVSFKIYPNPASDQLFVDVAQYSGSYHVIDVFGRTFMKGYLSDGKNTLYVSHLPKGVYTLVCSDKVLLKFVKD